MPALLSLSIARFGQAGAAEQVGGGGFESLDGFANASGLAHVSHAPGADGFVCAAGLETTQSVF